VGGGSTARLLVASGCVMSKAGPARGRHWTRRSTDADSQAPVEEPVELLAACLGQMEAGRARKSLPGPPWDLRQSPRSVRNRLVYSSGVVLETELQVGEA